MFSTTVLVSLLILLSPPTQSAFFSPSLNFTSASPYIFHSIATLLQVLPQTLFPNGHTIASVIIPKNTLLYHGRHDDNEVPSPEWLAFDIEMAYGIMGNMRDSRMLTYRSMKDIKAVYFDGTSATLMGEGTMSQMVFIYNGSEKVPNRGGFGPPPRRGHKGRAQERMDGVQGDVPKWPPPHWNPLEDEYFRARELCKWLRTRGLGGSGWGYEGIVRMNAGFELIWCDFESPSLKLVSNLNVSGPRYEDGSPNLLGYGQVLQLASPVAQARLRINEDEGPHGPGMTDPKEPFRGSSTWFWFASAARRYFGDSRIKVNQCGIFSFYEPGLHNQSRARIEHDLEELQLDSEGKWIAPPGWDLPAKEASLDSLKKRRRHHSVTNVDKKDGIYMRNAVESRLKIALKEDYSCTDWHGITQEVTIRYSKELLSLVDHLHRFPDWSWDGKAVLEKWIYELRQLTHWFLMPFFEYPPGQPYPKDKVKLTRIFDINSPLGKQTIERCIIQYETHKEDLSDSDEIYQHAIKDVLEGICTAALKIAFGVEVLWFLHFNSISQGWNDDSLFKRYSDVKMEVFYWEDTIVELLSWLGWADQSTFCKEKCRIDEFCYLPMWPVSGWVRRRNPKGNPHFPKNLTPPSSQSDPRYLWDPICVGIDEYPPEEHEGKMNGIEL